jgi:hypothetical protein
VTTTPPEPAAETASDAPARRSRAATAALILTIGTLLGAAVLGGYFIIVGDQANVAGRAWLTLLLVAAFAGAVVLDANVANGPNRWYLAASTIINVVLVAVGLLKLWNGWLQPADTSDGLVWIVQAWRLLAVIVLLRVALLVTQLYGLYFVARAKSRVVKYVSILTIVLVWATALILAIPAAFPAPDWPDWWWRAAGASALVAVVSLVIPLVVRAFDPKEPKPARPAPAFVQPGQYQAPTAYTPPQQPLAPPPPPAPVVPPAPPAAPQQAPAIPPAAPAPEQPGVPPVPPPPQ